MAMKSNNIKRLPTLLRSIFKNHPEMSIWTAICAILLIFVLYSPWRGPISFPKVYWNNGNAVDDSAAITSIVNYKKEGFFATKGNENRRGMVLQDYFSIPCLKADGTAPTELDLLAVPKYQDIDSLPIPLYAHSNTCYYHRTPPLHSWINYFVLSPFSFSLYVIHAWQVLINLLWLWAIYLYLTLFTKRRSAFLAVAFFSCSMMFLGWIQSLYNQLYQHLFFTLALYFFEKNSGSKKNKFFLLLFSMLHALCTFELIPFQFLYMLFRTTRERIQSMVLGSIGLFSSIGLFVLWTRLFSFDKSNVFTNLTTFVQSRYPVTLNWSEWFLELWQQIINCLSETLVPSYIILTLLIALLFFSTFKQKIKTFSLIFALFFGAWGFFFILPGHSSYHFFILLRAFILSYLFILASSLDLMWQKREEAQKWKKVFLQVVLLSLTFQSIVYVSRYSSTYLTGQDDHNILRQNNGYLFSLYPSSPEVVKISQNDKWYYYFFKNRLIDGKVPQNSETPDASGLPITPIYEIHLDWFFLNDIKVNSFEIDSDQSTIFESCKLFGARQGKLFPILLPQNRTEQRKYLFHTKASFPATVIDRLSLHCRPSNAIKLFEVRARGESRD